MGVEVLSAIMSLYHMYFLTFGVEGFPEGPAVIGNPIRHLGYSLFKAGTCVYQRFAQTRS